MKMHSSHCIRYRCGEVQEWAFYAGALAGLAFIVGAILGMERYAMTAAILGSLALGVSIGAWVVASRFKD